VDKVQSVLGCRGVPGSHGRHWLADVAGLVYRRGVFRDGGAKPGSIPPGAEGVRHSPYVLRREGSDNAREPGRLAYVDADDPCMRIGAAEYRGVEEARESVVVDEVTAPGDVAGRLSTPY
jgi:hypothetical protein